MNGTLEDTTPAGVLQVLSSERRTGAVRFLGEAGCTVYLHHGELYFAEGADTAENLSVALVRPGRLSAAEWDSSTEAGYPTETVGDALVATGSITRELLASIVLSVIYDPLIQLFRAPEGDYEFAADVMHWIGPYRTFQVDSIVAEVRRRTREADEMAPVVPSLDAVVRSARTLPDARGSVNLRRDDWEVVVAAANGRTISELAVDLGRGRWSTARLVYRLATADLLMVSSDVDAGIDGTQADPAESSASDVLGGFDLDQAPPPLDSDTLATGTATAPAVEPAPQESWGFTDPVSPPEADAGRGSDDPGAASPASDPWALPDDAPSSGSAWDSPDPFAELDAIADDPGFDDPGFDDTGFDDTGEAPNLTAVPDTADQTAEFEPPALHPDIAKALAESTYADSATAINAMAARLGAADADTDDDWDTGAPDDTVGDDFWSSGGDADFNWEPAEWDTGVEATPLPQREHSGHGMESPAGSADPAWLNNLYSQFMPGEAGADAANDKAAPTPDPGAAPKQRTLKRLISAIKRL